MLDFRIETFLSVCKYMNYTRAAEELRITQPGVSQHIRYLENYYGDKLFRYANKSLELTQAGMELRDAMIAVKHDNIFLKRLIREQTSEKKSIRFGATLTVGEFLLPDKLLHYMKKNSDVQVSFEIANTKELLSLLEDGQIDFAVVEGYFQKSEYEYRTVSREPYILVCGTDYPIGKISTISDLLSHLLIVREEGSGTKDIFERYLAERGYSVCDFASVATVSSIHVIKQLLENNCGISSMYEVAVKKDLREGKLRRIELSDFPLYHEFNYIWRKNSVFKEYYQELFSFIHDKYDI